jgi:hypothetical protein
MRLFTVQWIFKQAIKNSCHFIVYHLWAVIFSKDIFECIHYTNARFLDAALVFPSWQSSRYSKGQCHNIFLDWAEHKLYTLYISGVWLTLLLFLTKASFLLIVQTVHKKVQISMYSKFREMSGQVGSEPACYGSSPGSNTDISQKHKMGDVGCSGVANTL